MTIFKFQSTRPVWGATLHFRKHYIIIIVSIHAPRVGRDLRPRDIDLWVNVSIHAPRVGRDFAGSCSVKLPRVFQSTRPVWGATVSTALTNDFEDVSIHAPRVGRDTGGVRQSGWCLCFNPRAPCGARPRVCAA